MIKDVYKTIEEIEDDNYYFYRLNSNGSSFKRIEEKDIFLNQKKLTPFYMWESSASFSSSAHTPSYEQFKYLVSSSVDFTNLSRANVNKGNAKIFAHSASLGYVLNYNTLLLDKNHNNVLYYYGYANYYGSGSPFNVTQSGQINDISDEAKSISPSKIAYKSIKAIISDQRFVENAFIQISQSFNTTEFIYVKIPRRIYHEELLKGSFELCLQQGDTTLFLTDPEKYNIGYTENNISYIVSGANKDDLKLVSGNYDIYGILDRKNAIAIIDVPKLETVFGTSYFTTGSFTSSLKEYEKIIYEVNPESNKYGFYTIDSTEMESYSASYYPNMENISILFYSGSKTKQFSAIGLETQITDEYYLKIGAGEFNSSTNPTYLIGTRIKDFFVKNPVTYITTIGLYNDANQCLAVAKLSKPIKKDFETAYNIKIQLKQ
jgi:hypothetical protein